MSEIFIEAFRNMHISSWIQLPFREILVIIFIIFIVTKNVQFITRKFMSRI
jgi:hypothetical protein